MKARALIRQGATRLKDSPAIDHWQKGREKIEAEILLFDLLGEEPDPDDKISAKKQRTYEEWIERRHTGEPVAHITGTTDFMGLDLIVEPGVFVPRDSSEWLAMQAIKRLRKRKKPVHVDLASGMGTIALAVSSEVPKAEVFGAELSTEGVKLARRNARCCRKLRGTPNYCRRLRPLCPLPQLHRNIRKSSPRLFFPRIAIRTS